MTILTELEKKEIIEKKKLELVNHCLSKILETALKNLYTTTIGDLDYYIIKQVAKITNNNSAALALVAKFRELAAEKIKKLN